jgi:MFS family permease
MTGLERIASSSSEGFSTPGSCSGAPNGPRQRTNIPSLVCAIMASLTTGGTTYAFGLYGAAMKKTLHLSQGQLDTISTAFFFAGLFSWIPGLCADRFGTRFAMSLGGCLGSSSLLTYWAVARQFLLLPHSWLVPTLSILGISIFLSSALVTGSVFKIIVASCGPGTKGSAVGVAKGFVGLGAGFYACLFNSIQQPGESNLDFLPMAAFFTMTCATLPALLLLPSREKVQQEVFRDEATPLHFRTMYISLIVMATLIVGNSLAELMDYDDSRSGVADQGGTNYTMALLLVTVWLGPILGLLYLPRGRNETHVMVLEDEIDGITERERVDDGTAIKEDSIVAVAQDAETIGLDPLAVDNDNDDDKEESVVPTDGEDEDLSLIAHEDSNDNRPAAEEPEEVSLNLMQMLQTPSALLMLWTTIILVGAGTVETNNMGQMVEALSFPEQVTSASLALFSVAQAAARVVTGGLSESALNWNTRNCFIDNGVPRPAFLVAASLVGFAAHFLLAVATDEVPFVFGATLSGAAFGMVWPLMVLIVGEVFGTAHVGANYMFFDGFTSAVGTLFLTKVSVFDAT